MATSIMLSVLAVIVVGCLVVIVLATVESLGRSWEEDGR